MRKDLKVFRVMQDLTQEEMAARVGITRANYNLIENGKSNGGFKFWIKLQNEFNLTDEQVWKMKVNVI